MVDLQDIRERPYYTAGELALYSGIKPGCLRAWIRRHKGDIIRQHVGSRGAVYSFMNLVEAYIVSLLKEKGVTMQRIRKGIDYLANAHPEIVHPLANFKYLSTDGRDLFKDDSQGGCYSASENGQYVIPDIMDNYLWRFKLGEDGLPVLFTPPRGSANASDRNKADICINPRVLCGQPVIAGTRIPARMIAGLFEAGESMDALVADYQLTQEQVQAAIRFFTVSKAS